MCIAGALGGLAYAAIPAFLKTRFNVNEILSSLMLSYVSIQLLYYLMNGPWKDPEGFNFPQTPALQRQPDPALHQRHRLPERAARAGRSRSAVWFLMAKTTFGFQVRVVGAAPQAARYGGFSRDRTIWLSLLAGGGLAGLAGIFEAAGPFGQMVPQFPTGYGFTAIIVAFLGRLHPIGIVILGGLILAVTYVGGESAQASLGLPELGDRRVPGDDAVLPARHRHPRQLPAAPAPPRGSRAMSNAVYHLDPDDRSSAAATPLAARRARRAGGREVAAS